MNKKNFFVVFVIATGMVSSAMITMRSSEQRVSELVLNEIEAISNCESVDGHPNDGHCVHDGYLHYFCATVEPEQEVNCLQQK